MTLNLIRDAPLGSWLRLTAWGRKLLPFPEELPDFQCPPEYYKGKTLSNVGSLSPTVTLVGSNQQSYRDGSTPPDQLQELGKQVTPNEKSPSSPSAMQTAVATGKSASDAGLEAGYVSREGKNLLPSESILVDWYTSRDPAHPWRWSAGRKAFVAFIIIFLTFNVYGGSSIITASFPGLQAKYGIGNAEVSVTLAVYVFAYGFGALIFSPLSEIPKLGRNVFYIYPMMAFVLLQVGCATADTYYGLCILRFLTGLVGAPCLATGGASLQDAFPPDMLGPLISFWALAAFAAPSLAPIMGTYATVRMNDWRWSMWILLIQVGITTILLAFLPETSHDYILMHRAQQLRRLTGNKNIRSRAEIDQAHLSPRGIFVKAIIRPTEIFLKDPAITYIHLYTAFIYGIYYLFFESYPLVFQGIYRMSFQVSSLGYLGFIVGALIACASYLAYLFIRFGPVFQRGEQPVPEQWMDATLVSTILAPIGMYIFAWTSRESIHWAAPLAGVVLFGGACFVTVQCLFAYILSVYPKYGASLLAGNDFLRSSVAAGLLFAGQPMFRAMGIGGGNSFLGGLLVLGTAGAYFVRFFGARLRARSRFTD